MVGYWTGRQQSPTTTRLCAEKTTHAGVAAAPPRSRDWAYSNSVAGIGSIDHFAISNINSDVMRSALKKEDEVAGLGVAFLDFPDLVVLSLGIVGE